MVPLQTSRHTAFTSSFIVLYCRPDTMKVATRVIQQGVAQTCRFEYANAVWVKRRKDPIHKHITLTQKQYLDHSQKMAIGLRVE